MKRFNIELDVHLNPLANSVPVSSAVKSYKRQRREDDAAAHPALDVALHTCIISGRQCRSRIGLSSHLTIHQLDSLEEVDLLQAIAVPFADSSTQYFVTGFDGFPAFGFKVGASIKHPYRLFMPERFYRRFSIMIAMKPDTVSPMFVFAVTNPLENIIQLGVGFIPADQGMSNVSLYYTDGERHMTSQTIASFLVPQFVGSWSRLAFSVTEEDIQLWYNCELYSDVLVKRVPLQLVFDSASTLYIGQAGGIFKGDFEGALQELKIYNDPSLAKVQCDDSFTVSTSL
ncbi:collagen alpha-1(XV) chain-like [Homarus americanus]|uniref:collagen alpha-1(XV) chain-like n=1 Tax=Homarus americanus TaxID=6706 RepID=UPI001C465C4E|nr:collagen alpha-1(XV) chain-like [Homarus americanus]